MSMDGSSYPYQSTLGQMEPHMTRIYMQESRVDGKLEAHEYRCTKFVILFTVRDEQ